MSPPFRFFFCRIFPFLFIGVGAIVLYYGVEEIKCARESPAWPTAQGVIRLSTLEYRRDTEGGGTYYAEVMYEFKVFSGNRLSFGSFDVNYPAKARRIVNRYSEGKIVMVHYLTDNPEVKVLEPGAKGQVLFLPAIGLVFCVTGYVMAVYLPKEIMERNVR